MRRISSADFVRNLSAYCDEALASEVVLTRNGRDRLVIMDVGKFRRLLTSLNAASGREGGDMSERKDPRSVRPSATPFGSRSVTAA